MKYTVRDFNNQFPTDAACLEFIFQTRFPDGGICKCGKSDCFYPVTTRRCYSCSWCGHQVSPTEGTIFHKSRTSLKSWFFAMFLMSSSKNGVAAKELQRQLGVTYKTAWRMNHQIRKLMSQGDGFLGGIVEADETKVGGIAKNMHRARRQKMIHGSGNKAQTVVAGLIERGGDVRAKVVENSKVATLVPNIVANVLPGSVICSDELLSYKDLHDGGYIHVTVRHSGFEYVDGIVHTNSIESFWSQLKRSLDGTFHSVSGKHLQNYVNEFAYRHNLRNDECPVFVDLSARVAERHVAVA